MRTLPAGWPDPDDPNQTAFTVYLHVLDGVWPPASIHDGESLPAGWAVVGEWTIDADLDAPLMPGQVNAGSTFTVASGACTIPQPEGGLLAPWRVGDERTPHSGHCELVASYNGYSGSTAFVLGKFLLDPIKGKVSEPVLSLSLVQDLVRLRKPHDVERNAGPFSTASPTRYLEQAAAKNGYLLDSSGDFPAVLTSLYYPGKTDELTVLQSIVGANLGALYLSMDGTTIIVKDPDSLLGTGTVDATLSVLDSFDDLSWSQDPNAAVDRIELTYLPPSYYQEAFGVGAWFDEAVVWSAPKGASIAAGETKVFNFDPGTDILINGVSSGTGAAEIRFHANSSADGTGTAYEWEAYVSQVSSGSYTLTVTNPTAGTRYFVAPYSPGGDYPKGTRSFINGTLNGAKEGESSRTLVWGVASEDATNTLTFDLGRNIQREVDARAILNRIVTRITQPTFVIDDVRVVPDVRRELGDLYRVRLEEVGFDTRAMVTGIKLSGGPGGIEQTLTIAGLGLILLDFDAAWDAAHPGATINDFDDVWAGKTVEDFDRDPLAT